MKIFKPIKIKYLRLAWMLDMEIGSPVGVYEEDLNRGIAKLRKKLCKR